MVGEEDGERGEEGEVADGEQENLSLIIEEIEDLQNVSDVKW